MKEKQLLKTSYHLEVFIYRNTHTFYFVHF